MSFDLSKILNNPQVTSAIIAQQSAVDSDELSLFEVKDDFEEVAVISSEDLVETVETTDTNKETPVKDFFKGLKSFATNEPVYEYDEDGNVTAMINGLTKTEYDEDGNIIRVTERSITDGKTVTEYDEDGNITSITKDSIISDETVTEYDEDGNITSIMEGSKTSGGTETKYTYYENGGIKTETIVQYPNTLDNPALYYIDYQGSDNDVTITINNYDEDGNLTSSETYTMSSEEYSYLEEAIDEGLVEWAADDDTSSAIEEIFETISEDVSDDGVDIPDIFDV